METKDLILLMLIPIILISILIYTDRTPLITAAVTSQQEKSNKLGTYSILPSFKAKIDYDLINEYNDLNEELKKIINECKKEQDIEKCFEDKSKEHKWDCIEKDETYILYEFIDNFNECKNLKRENECKNLKEEECNIVCRFSFDGKKSLNIDSKRKFEIVLTNDINRIKAELVENEVTIAPGMLEPFENKILLATEFIDQENLLFVDSYGNREEEGKIADVIRIQIKYQDNKPKIEKIIKEDNGKEIELSPDLFYKSKHGIKFIDVAVKAAFGEHPANKIIDLPRIKGFKFCAKSKSGNEVYAYDKSDNKVHPRDIVYQFAITYPKQNIPKPIKNLEVFDALKAENAVILTWSLNEEENVQNIDQFVIYYSTKSFHEIKTGDIKNDPEKYKYIKTKSVSNEPLIKINSIDLKNCLIGIGPCKYPSYNKILEKNNLYYWTSKNKFIYLLSDSEGIIDDKENYFAVTAVSKGSEINIFEENKNYKEFMPRDDLAPDRVSGIKYEHGGSGIINLIWYQPLRNVDGSNSNDIESFNIYYTKAENTVPYEGTKKRIRIQYAQCSDKIQCEDEYCYNQLRCETSIGGTLIEKLESGETYSFDVTAIDEKQNEFRDSDYIHVISQ